MAAPYGLLASQGWQGLLGKAGGFLGNNSNMLTTMGAELLNYSRSPVGPIFNQQALAYGMRGDQEKRQQKKTQKFLMDKFGMSSQEAEAGAGDKELLNFLLASPKEREIRNDANGIPRYVDSGEAIYPGDNSANTGTDFFSGRSVEAQGLNYLLGQNIITKQQAANMAAGKPVNGPNGQVYFLTPEGVFQQSPSGGEPQPVGGAPTENGTAPGIIEVIPGRTDQNTDTQRNRRSQITSATAAIEGELTRYEDLVNTYGVEAAPGQAKDQLNAVRQGILLQLKELFNLGVLNGPDLELMEKMLYDPVVDPAKEGGAGNIPGQVYSSVVGNAAARAKSGANELRRIINGIKSSVTGGTAPPTDPSADPFGIR